MAGAALPCPSARAQINSAPTSCTLLRSEDDSKLSAAGESLEGRDVVHRELGRLEAHMNPMKCNKVKCKVLQLGRGSPWYLCRVGDEWIESSPEENLDWMVDWT